MARRRTSERKVQQQLQQTDALLVRIERAEAEPNMSDKELMSVKQTRRGIMEHMGQQYYFVANRNTMPVVFGATSVEIVLELVKALDNKMLECKSKSKYYKAGVKELYAQPNVYTDEMAAGILVIKAEGKYIGYMPGKAGMRAVTYRKGGKPYSCAVKSLIKSLDKPGNRPFRTMQSQGEDIRNMIPHFMKIVEILDARTNKPDPSNDGPGKNTQENNKETKENSTPHRRRRRNTEQKLENKIEERKEVMPEQQQTPEERIEDTKEIKPIKTKESYCGCCNMVTIQKIISDSELQCMVCGECWERFDEPEEEIIIETKEEIIQETNEEITQETEDNNTETKEEEKVETKEEKMIETKEKEPTIHPKMKRRKRRNTNDNKPRTTNDSQDTNDNSNTDTKEKKITEHKRQGRGGRRHSNAARDVSSVRGSAIDVDGQVLDNDAGAL